MTKAMTEVKLKPCPFCGSEDFVLGFHEGHNEMRVKCKRCKTLFTIFDTPKNAPKLWNRRTYCYQAERAVQNMTAEKAIEVLNEIGEETNIEDTLKNLSNSNTFITARIGKIRCRYPSTKNGNGRTINAPFATPSSKRADLNFAGVADRLLTGQMKRKVKNNEKRDNS